MTAEETYFDRFIEEAEKLNAKAGDGAFNLVGKTITVILKLAKEFNQIDKIDRQAYAESIAKERAVELMKRNQVFRDIEDIEKEYDTFLAEKRKEGAEKSFCECGSQKDPDCKYCTSCNKFHSV